MQKKASSALPQILLVASEAMPLAKTGGLADVVGSLPRALAQLGYDARIILPYHQSIKARYGQQVSHLCSFSVDLGWRSQYVGLEKLVLSDVTYYLIDNEYYFGDRIYRGGNSEIEQYSFFCRAVLESLGKLDFSPQILHLQDWQTAMIAPLLKTQYQGRAEGGLKTLLTIHNLAFQGKCGFDFLQDLLNLDDSLNQIGQLQHDGAANCLKGGLLYADKLSTVSPSYAEEIKLPYYGEGLDGVLRLRAADLSGILNGLDQEVFNPASDPALPSNYQQGNLAGKYHCKQALCEELGLHYQADLPLLGMVSRLTAQKGLDLLAYSLDSLMQEQLCVVVLGQGDAKYEALLREAEARYKGRFCAYIGYREELSRRVYAGSDFFLMPSIFEPCGLAQLIAMRYGSLPIVRETGGLKDTVLPYNKYSGLGTGFSFANENAQEMADAVRRALWLYQDKDAMLSMIDQAMAADFGLERPAAAYANLYQTLVAAV